MTSQDQDEIRAALDSALDEFDDDDDDDDENGDRDESPSSVTQPPMPTEAAETKQAVRKMAPMGPPRPPPSFSDTKDESFLMKQLMEMMQQEMGGSLPDHRPTTTNKTTNNYDTNNAPPELAMMENFLQHVESQLAQEIQAMDQPKSQSKSQPTRKEKKSIHKSASHTPKQNSNATALDQPGSNNNDKNNQKDDVSFEASLPAFATETGTTTNNDTTATPTKCKTLSNGQATNDEKEKTAATKSKGWCSGNGNGVNASTASDNPFDETIANLVESLAKNAAQEEEGEVAHGDDDDSCMGDGSLEAALLEKLLMQVTGGNDETGGEGNPDALLQGIMEELMSKELMYEPIQQVAAEFPNWLARNKDTLTPEEYKQRQSQSQAFARLAKAYDQSNNNNSNKHLTSHLVHLMQEVQEYGQPPPDLIQTIAPGLSLDADGLPNLGQDDCRTM